MPNAMSSFDEFLNKPVLMSNMECPEAAALQREFEETFGLKVTCIPNDDPLGGEVGFVIFNNENGQEKMMIISRRFGPKATIVKLKLRSEIEDQYAKDVKGDFPITRYDDPKALRVGYIVSCASGGRIWYNISLTALRDTSKETE